MTELDAELGPLAGELIDEFGTTIQFGRVVAGAYDPATGTAAPTNDASSIKAVIESVRVGQAKGLVEVGDIVLTIAASSLPNGVSPEDRATIGGIAHKVVTSSVTYTGDNPALYTVVVRK